MVWRFFFLIYFFFAMSVPARCNEERWMPNRGTGSHGCNLLLALELSWHYVMILCVKWHVTILLCTTGYLILDWRCVFVRGCVCLLVHFWSVSFSAVVEMSTQRIASVQPYWLANGGDQWLFSRGRDCTACTDLRDRCNECTLVHTRMNTSTSHNL